MWFYYQRNFKREWTPVKSPERPNSKSVNGTKIITTGVRQLDSVEASFDLDSLAEIYPAPEEEYVNG